MGIGIVVKNWEHFNKSLPNWHSKDGRYIGSRRQYENEVRQAGLIPFEQAEEMRIRNEETAKKNRKYSRDTIEFLGTVSNKADKKGKVNLSDRQVDYMISKGAIKDRDVFADKLPKHYQDKGGWS